MGKNKPRQHQQEEIDLLELARAVLDKAVVVILAAILCGAMAFGYTKFMITPMYRASVLMYVNNSSVSVGSMSVRISSGELNAAQSLIETYSVILKSRNTLEAVKREADVNYSYGQLKGMISSAAVNGTEIFEIAVRSSSPTEAKLIANTIADVLPDKISDIVDNSSVRVVDYAVTPVSPISPSYSNNTMKGVLLGLVLGCGYAVLCYFLDDKIHSEDYLVDNFDIPVLAAIPDLYAHTSGNYSYGSATAKEDK